MMNIEELIEIAVQRDASDIHLTIGVKPMLRIVRKLVPQCGTFLQKCDKNTKKPCKSVIKI